jgi:hypothetical protein
VSFCPPSAVNQMSANNEPPDAGSNGAYMRLSPSTHIHPAGFVASPPILFKRYSETPFVLVQSNAALGLKPEWTLVGLRLD